MLPRGRPRALGAATLLLLVVVVVGFFLFGRDPECERRELGRRGGDLVCLCLLMPRVLSDGLQAAATFDGDPDGSRNRSTSNLQPLLPPKCEVGARDLWWLPPPGFLAPAQPSGHLSESKHLTSGHQAGTPEDA